MTLKKGDRVEWLQNSGQSNKTHYGVVAKGGAKRVTVVRDGGELQVSGSPAHFKLSDKPLPNATEVNPMSAYTIKAYKEISGHGDSPTFSAKICKNGKAIIHAGNNGWGGPNEYHFLGQGHLTQSLAMVKFLQAAKDWAKEATGQDDVDEAEDLWITWEVFERPYGRSAAESLEWLVKMMSEKTA